MQENQGLQGFLETFPCGSILSSPAQLSVEKLVKSSLSALFVLSGIPKRPEKDHKILERKGIFNLPILCECGMMKALGGQIS
jgi:hypothetical protein